MSDSWQNDLLKILYHILEGLRLFRRGFWNARFDFTRPCAGQYWIAAHILKIISDPINRLVGTFSEKLWR